MPTGNEKFNAAANAALCNMLQTVGGTAASYAAWGLITPGPFDEWVALGVAGIAGLAYATGCQWDPGNQSANQGGQIDGCNEVTGGVAQLQFKSSSTNNVWNNADPHTYPGADRVTKITAAKYFESGLKYAWQLQFVADGIERTYAQYNQPLDSVQSLHWRLNPLAGATCVGSSNPGDPLPPVLPPYTYTDPDDGCKINATFQGWMAGPGGSTGAVWKLEPGTQSFASGGIIGGCNFRPVVYYQPPGGGGPGGGGGGGPIIPWVPGPPGAGGEPWWAPVVRGAIQGAAGELLRRIFETRYSADVYRVVSVCEKDAQGEAVSLAREFQIPSQPSLDAIVSRLNGIAYVLQGLKDFKQPICEPEPPPAPVGKNISIQFRSTVPSPFGHERLRKVFRYRDPSLKELEEHRDHWKDFEWESGPWMVISEGLLWGKPRVWAKSEAEGKRVLRHAAQICGLNLDSPAHRWIVREVQAFRERPVLKMKIHRDARGHYWIAERTGSEGFPMVAGQLSSDINVGN